jgi:hypothetical protein
MSPVVVYTLVAVGVLLATGLALDLAARYSRYRHYRRAYPSAQRGRVWRHVK